MDVRTYIQSKGRARHVHSQYILLLDKGNLRFINRYNEFKKIEQYLQEVSYNYFYLTLKIYKLIIVFTNFLFFN